MGGWGGGSSRVFHLSPIAMIYGSITFHHFSAGSSYLLPYKSSLGDSLSGRFSRLFTSRSAVLSFRAARGRSRVRHGCFLFGAALPLSGSSPLGAHTDPGHIPSPRAPGKRQSGRVALVSELRSAFCFRKSFSMHRPLSPGRLPGSTPRPPPRSPPPRPRDVYIPV